MMNKSFLLSFLMFFALLFVANELMAQSNSYPDVVELKNGSVLKCKILEYELDGNIKVEIMGGSVLVYPADDVLKIDREGKTEDQLKLKKEEENFHVFEDGMFYQLGIDILGGLKDDGWGWTVPTLGLGAKFTAGKVINRSLMIGGGIGWVFMDNGIMFSPHIPIYAQVRGDLMKRKYAFYYTASLGYNWALHTGNTAWNGTQMTAARGGVYFNPGLGLRFASRGRSHLCLEFGYSIHTASYDFLGANGDIAITRNRMIRPKLGCAIMF
jgi:hypothetical protein